MKIFKMKNCNLKKGLSPTVQWGESVDQRRLLDNLLNENLKYFYKISKFIVSDELLYLSACQLSSQAIHLWLIC